MFLALFQHVVLLWVDTDDGHNLSLATLLRKCRGTRKFRATLAAQGNAAALTLSFAAKDPATFTAKSVRQSCSEREVAA